ncbi:MAG: biotin--[acetyl-CoA-carboxylase] ligase [Micromonosporaceae bacterium]|nr:biotin--[acetyl-CoA-carboxylase] ligase [Micromonosporaceae bacterium]
MGAGYLDLEGSCSERQPLSESDLRGAVLLPGGLWTALRVVGRAASTNTDLVAAGGRGADEGTILVAEEQVSGKGRLGRSWQSPPRAGIAVSVLLRPGLPRHRWPTVPADRFGWLPLLAGVALTQAVRRVGAVDAGLKWPNDLMVGQRKCAGILAETFSGPAASPLAVVVGTGLNVTLREEELPHPMATSLSLVGARCQDRHSVLVAFLRDFETWYVRWRSCAGDPDRSGLRSAYQEYCTTLGSSVLVSLPGGATLDGIAHEIDVEGRLVVRGGGGEHTVLAVGDVVHVRPGDGQGGMCGIPSDCAHQ